MCGAVSKNVATFLPKHLFCYCILAPKNPNESDKKKKKECRLEFLKTDLRDGKCQSPSCIVKFTLMDLKVSTVRVTQVSFTSDTADLMTREV